MDANKRFPIQEAPWYGIYPGKTADGNPVIAFAASEEFMMVYFGSEGQMLRYALETWTKPKVLADADTHDARYEAWKKEHELARAQLLARGFASHETVQVQQFWLDGYAIGIMQYPASLNDALAEEEREYDDIDQSPLPPYEHVLLDASLPVDEQEMDELREDLKEWRERGNFVLYHGNDYWCNAEGKITSSYTP